MSATRIVLYATRACPHCAAARAAILATGVPFDERDPLSNPEVLREMLECSAAAVVPTIVVGGRTLVGFDAERLAEMLRETPLDPASADNYTADELAGDDSDLPVIR